MISEALTSVIVLNNMRFLLVAVQLILLLGAFLELAVPALDINGDYISAASDVMVLLR